MCDMMLERARKVYDMHCDGHKLVFYKRTGGGNSVLVESVEYADIVTIQNSPLSCPKDLFIQLTKSEDKFDPLPGIPM